MNQITPRIVRRFAAALCAVVASLALTPIASAQRFEGATMIDVSAEVGTPPSLRTYRVYLHFSDAEGVGVYAIGPWNQVGLVIEVNGGTILINSAGPFGGTAFEDFPFPGIEAWDSWVTLGAATPMGIGTQPVFTGTWEGSTQSRISGALIDEADAGWRVADGEPMLGGEDVLIAQFTVVAGHAVEMLGAVTWFDREGVQHQDPFLPVFSSCERLTEPPTEFSFAHPADLDADGIVGFTDLVAVLGHWGQPVTWSLDEATYAASGTFFSCITGGCTGSFDVADAGLGGLDTTFSVSMLPRELTYGLRSEARLEDGTAVFELHADMLISIPIFCGEFGAVGTIDMALDLTTTEPIDYALTTTGDCWFDPGDPIEARVLGTDAGTVYCEGRGTLLAGTPRFQLRQFPNSFGGTRDYETTGTLTLDDASGLFDLDDDFDVDFEDVLIVLSAWGPIR